jgi:hypothetical protein
MLSATTTGPLSGVVAVMTARTTSPRFTTENDVETGYVRIIDAGEDDACRHQFRRMHL